MKFIITVKKEFLMLLAGITLLSCNNSGNQGYHYNSGNQSMDSAQNMNETKFPDSLSKQQYAQYLMEVYSDELFVLKSSKEALKKTSDRKVKKLASFLIQTHTSLSREMNGLATKKNISLPEGLSQDQQNQLSSLVTKKGPDFNEDYLRQMVNDHKNITVLLNQATQSNDGEIINWANKTLPIIRKSGDLINACQHKVDSLHKK